MASLNSGLGELVMAGRGTSKPWRDVWLANTTWDQHTASDLQEHLYDKVHLAPYMVLVMNGGTTELAGGQSGASLYTEMGVCATAARAAGFDAVVACTVPTYTGIPGAVNTQRLALQTALNGDASGYFDDVADIAAALDGSWASTTSDGIHLNSTGKGLADGVLNPILDTLLA